MDYNKSDRSQRWIMRKDGMLHEMECNRKWITRDAPSQKLDDQRCLTGIVSQEIDHSKQMTINLL
jgi:hypothetical protein